MPTPSIENSELLYRQMGPAGDPVYFDPARTPPVHHALFLPARSDSDGLSLIRSRLRTEIWSAFRVEQPTVRFRLACLQAQSLTQVAANCGIPVLTFLPTPDGLDNQHGEPLGHCVVKEINRAAYDSDQGAKKRIKEWARGISSLLANNDVIGPFAQPTESDPYRPPNQQ